MISGATVGGAPCVEGLRHSQRLYPKNASFSRISSRQFRSFSCTRQPHQKRVADRACTFRCQATASQSPAQIRSVGTKTVLQFYDRYNAGDIDGVMETIADGCSYHDTIYEDPFVGKDAIREYFAKVQSILGPTLMFVVDNITDGDATSVGVKWHVETATGVKLPNSRGVSFYEISPEGKILTARDCVEPSIKPGAATLQVLRVVTPLLEKLGPNADPSALLSRVPVKSIALWLFYAGYIAFIFFSRSLPGSPILETPPAVLEEILHESVTFFYVTPLLNSIGITVVPDLKEFPVSEAVFNFMNAWSFMFLPVMLADPKAAGMRYKIPLYLGIQFLTNVFTIPYMALRELAASREGSDEPSREGSDEPSIPSYAPVVGVVAGTVGAISLGWALIGRPEYGGLVDRWDWFVTAFLSNRAFFAFILDAGLYSVWQAVILVDLKAAALFRYTPFFGMAGWLLTSLKNGPRQLARGSNE